MNPLLCNVTNKYFMIIEHIDIKLWLISIEKKDISSRELLFKLCMHWNTIKVGSTAQCWIKRSFCANQLLRLWNILVVGCPFTNPTAWLLKPYVSWVELCLTIALWELLRSPTLMLLHINICVCAGACTEAQRCIVTLELYEVHGAI